MKPKAKEPEIIFRIIDHDTGNLVGSYSRSCHDKYDFKSVKSARGANCHGMFKDEEKYKIAKYLVTYELLDDNAQ